MRESACGERVATRPHPALLVLLLVLVVVCEVGRAESRPVDFVCDRGSRRRAMHTVAEMETELQGAAESPLNSCSPRSTTSLSTVLWAYSRLITGKLEWLVVTLEDRLINGSCNSNQIEAEDQPPASAASASSLAATRTPDTPWFPREEDAAPYIKRVTARRANRRALTFLPVESALTSTNEWRAEAGLREEIETGSETGLGFRADFGELVGEDEAAVTQVSHPLYR
ncbi:unnamed protein product [Merluccius merluccius]